MNPVYDFDKTVLLRDEIKSLRAVSRHSVPRSSVLHFDTLYEADLVAYDLSEERDPANCRIRLDTVHISDKGLRYLVWLYRQRMKSIVIPIIVAVITSLLTNGIIKLLQLILLPK